MRVARTCCRRAGGSISPCARLRRRFSVDGTDHCKHLWRGASMKAFAAAALGLILSAQAAFAAEPVFPPASRIGIVPPADMMVSRRFSGFENEEKAAAINFVEMPAA